MNQNIAKKIENINKGIIPEGYKKTKVGIVPVEWREVKLGEILTQRKTLMCISENTPLLSFTIENGIIDPDDKKTNKRDFLIKDISTKKFALTEIGDIIYNPANLKFGAIHRNNLRRGVVSPIYGIFYGEQDSVFIGYLLHNQRFIDFAKTYTEGTVEKLKTLKADTFLKLRITIPPLPEQQKIAEILSTQDKLIKMLERKIEQLKKLKKGYLQKMFPKKGSSVPELRFKGFADPWEQRKLEDYCDMYNGDRSAKYPNAQDMVYDGIPFINAGDLEDGYVNLATANKITREKYDELGGAKLRLGDIVYCLRGTLGKNAYIDNFTEGTVASSLVALRPKNIDGRFLFHVLNSNIEYRQRIVHDEGAAQPNLSAKSVSEFTLPVPDVEEQKKISYFLDSLTNLITLHRRKLDKEKQKKNALMQLLLTGKVRVSI